MDKRQAQLKKVQVRGTGIQNVTGEKEKSKFPAAIRRVSALE